MPNTYKDFKKYLQFLTPCEQTVEIYRVIHSMLIHNNPDDDINKKYSIIKELNIIKKQLLYTHNQNNKY